MKIWKLSESRFEHSIFTTWGKVYLDPLNASNELFEHYSTRLNLHKDEVLIAEYHPATGANIILKDGRRWTWTIDILEVE